MPPDASSSASPEVRRLQGEVARLRRAVDELAMLNELAREIGAAGSAEAVMEHIVQQALRAVDGEQGVISLIGEEEEQDALKTFIRTGPDAAAQRPIQLNRSLLGWMRLYQQPLVIDDPVADTRFPGVPWDDSVRSVLCVPLMVQARLTGVLTVFNKADGGTFTAEDRRLLGILAVQSAQVIEHARLQEEEKRLLRIRQELRVAHRIQTTLLPDPLPTVPGYDVAGLGLPAQEVGGDFYDILPLSESRYLVYVGDVAGKGLPASLLMANMMASLRALALTTASASDLVERANRLLYRSTQRGQFVTLFLALLDAERHEVTYANAGHNPPLVLRADGTVEALDRGGLVLAGLPTSAYPDATCALAPGEVLVLFSDGIVEAMNPQREPFGDDRLAATVHAAAERGARGISREVLAAVRDHAAGAPQSDDITLLVLRRATG